MLIEVGQKRENERSRALEQNSLLKDHSFLRDFYANAIPRLELIIIFLSHRRSHGDR